jgi:hypothetical protein
MDSACDRFATSVHAWDVTMTRGVKQYNIGNLKKKSLKMKQKGEFLTTMDPSELTGLRNGCSFSRI